ncbi:MAG: hypothetical protein ACJAVA_000325 [Flavobacteriaceae bacterium]|jgi:hypothetical protein
MTKQQEEAVEEQKAFKWMQDKGYDRRACKEVAPTLAKYLNEQLILSGVSSMLILTPKDAEVFFNEIMNPKEANKALKKAMLKFITR